VFLETLAHVSKRLLNWREKMRLMDERHMLSSGRFCQAPVALASNLKGRALQFGNLGAANAATLK
jgi:hypothetical protein